MKTNQFIPVVLFIFCISASAVYAFPEFPESPVHEQRKAMYEKTKKVYGPKAAKSEDSAAADQGTADSKDQVKDKDGSKDTTAQGPAKDVTKVTRKNAVKSVPQPGTNSGVIPPPSKNMQKLRAAHEKAKKITSAQPSPVTSDIAGSVPLYQQSQGYQPNPQLQGYQPNQPLQGGYQPNLQQGYQPDQPLQGGYQPNLQQGYQPNQPLQGGYQPNLQPQQSQPYQQQQQQ